MFFGPIRFLAASPSVIAAASQSSTTASMNDGSFAFEKVNGLSPHWNRIDDMVDVYCPLVSEHSATAAEWTDMLRILTT